MKLNFSKVFQLPGNQPESEDGGVETLWSILCGEQVAALAFHLRSVLPLWQYYAKRHKSSALI